MSSPTLAPCPLSTAIDLVGDRWSLVIVRDIMFSDCRHFCELLELNAERISRSTLAQRFKHLVAGGVLRTQRDRLHSQRVNYCLTEFGIRLLPLIVQLGAWGALVRPVDGELAAQFHRLNRGGPALWRALMDELRAVHFAPQRLAGYRERASPPERPVLSRVLRVPSSHRQSGAPGAPTCTPPTQRAAGRRV
jgi:DNA-binding HxlR family transcriptional regulator